MQQPQSATPGMHVRDVDTPALLIDLDAFEFNLDLMAKLAQNAGVRVRPHAKTHKSPVIAKLQIARGAVGQCVQKVAEAEVLAWGGVQNIMVSNEVVGIGKLRRLAALARIADISVCVDHVNQVRDLELVASEANVSLEVLVEINAGGNRCGVDSADQALALAQRIDSSESLQFAGLQAYHGGAQHLRTDFERKTAIAKAADKARTAVALITDAGLKCKTVAGAGTGTFVHEMASGVYNEIQVGSYIFMDADYGRNLDEKGVPVTMFRQSLFVLSTVMSAAGSGRAALDAGHKAVAVESGLPLVWQRPDIHYVDASDEHGTLNFEAGTTGVSMGEKLFLVPGHCDPTVDRYDWYVGVRKDRVECLWPVAGRGGMQ